MHSNLVFYIPMQSNNKYLGWANNGGRFFENCFCGCAVSMPSAFFVETRHGTSLRSYCHAELVSASLKANDFIVESQNFASVQ